MHSPLEFIRNNAVADTGVRSHSFDMYLDVMQISIAAYDLKDIESKLNNPIFDFQDIFEGYSRISMSRLANVLAFLIHNNRISGIYDFWIRLIKIILNDILLDHRKSGVEFIILELCTALIMGRDFIKKKDYSNCLNLLEQIDPYEKYDSTLNKKKAEELHNFCMYGICSEYLRGYLTGMDTEDFIIKHWEVQKEKFNSEGRYMDPGCPIVYDITSRYRLALILHLGYEGVAADEMRDFLKKGAPGLLLQMSSSYKFPYGGRSNQFNFNEALTASMCEFYCLEFSNEGDMKTAGVFKNMAIKSIEGLDRWLTLSPARHIKNLFPADSNYGIDSYGTYERYMGTMGTFLTLAMMMCEKNIDITPMNLNEAGYIYETGVDFHKLFASCCRYSIEIDKKGDQAYDATGLGRIHYPGCPPELALSMPFALHPKYLLGDFSNTRSRAIGVSWTHNGLKEYLAGQNCEVKTEIHNENTSSLNFSLTYKIIGKGTIIENYSINKNGLTIISDCDFADISYCVPVLKTSGGEDSGVYIDAVSCSVYYDSWVYKIVWDNDCSVSFSDYLLYNRNGVYKELSISNKKRSIGIKLTISRSAK